MIQFFAPDILSNPVLPEGESLHAAKVLRLKAGDIIPVTDGKDNRYQCKIVEPHQKHTLVEILSAESVPQPWSGNIIMAVAPTKNLDRMEWMVEKMVEMGVNRIVPILCRHSERKELKLHRIQKIAISAMSQSLKTRLPIIDELTPLTQFVNDTCATFNGQKFVGYCNDNMPRNLLSCSLKHTENVVILIGPEGDFSEEEIKMLLDANFSAVTFGDIRLRTETAAIVALQTVHVVNQIRNCQLSM